MYVYICLYVETPATFSLVKGQCLQRVAHSYPSGNRLLLLWKLYCIENNYAMSSRNNCYKGNVIIILDAEN